MPEYRRFIAYFYEYINGKKQKNAGYAKVELRNGMWRILFRLTAGVLPQPPIQVYGFVREAGYLLGFPMGTMRPGREIVEEWAYRAESPIGREKYRLEDLTGIWIQSGDDRVFLTAWDDGAIEPDKFVLELPAETGRNVQEDIREDIVPQPPVDEQGGENQVQQEAPTQEEADQQTWEEETQVQEEEAPMQEEEVQAQEEVVIQQEEIQQEEIPSQGVSEAHTGNLMKELYGKRSHFQPFADQEITNCIMIMPCDIIRLQQEKWQVGRSSFLQHGFYQYRHLLIGMMQSGEYVLGVPGVKNPQEQYMAQMFGFDGFKASRTCEHGRVFGYWYRTLRMG